MFHLDRLLPHLQTLYYPGKACEGGTLELIMIFLIKLGSDFFITLGPRRPAFSALYRLTRTNTLAYLSRDVCHGKGFKGIMYVLLRLDPTHGEGPMDRLQAYWLEPTQVDHHTGVSL